MIVYQQVKSSFLSDVTDRVIEDVVSDAYLQKTGRYAPDSEVRSWRESLTQMAHVLMDKDIPDNIGVGIEFGIPQSSKRIDFILSGKSETNDPKLIIVELKQWSSSKLSDKDGIIIANRGGRAEREGAHPSYQAWSYAALLEGFNEAVYENGTELRPCAYLHNYTADGVIDNPCYAPYLDKAPVFLRGEEERRKLRDFIKQHVRHGDNAELIVKIENGRIRPSKMLVDSLASMLKGNQEFVLIDDQKVAYESCLAAARGASEQQKQVVIVQGGPGTGKSVVAINLLVTLSKLGLLTKYVSKNAAPRAVYKERLAGRMRQVEIANLFSGSGAFIETPANSFGALIVDEAHRLNRFSGLYENQGEHQIKEIINAAQCSIFFVDDDQVVTLKDIGTSLEIERWARELGAHVNHLELVSQFRCNGSDGYIAWLDHVLGVRPHEAQPEFDADGFDFRVVDSPSDLHQLIIERNKERNRARVVAGYCWDWASKRDQNAYDIEIPEFNYRRRWNLDRDGSLWIVAPNSVEEVGCIHTCQGLELDYVGVIIGPDMIVSADRIATDPTKRSRQDRSIRGFKSAMAAEPDVAFQRVDRIIRNTYRTLMTRGMKGCYVYCVDAKVREHFDTIANRGIFDGQGS
ncbi:DNA/RNA helicase domain-containing protein [Lysobacter sp. 2RAF19]